MFRLKNLCVFFGLIIMLSGCATGTKLVDKFAEFQTVSIEKAEFTPSSGEVEAAQQNKFKVVIVPPEEDKKIVKDAGLKKVFVSSIEKHLADAGVEVITQRLTNSLRSLGKFEASNQKRKTAKKNITRPRKIRKIFAVGRKTSHDPEVRVIQGSLADLGYLAPHEQTDVYDTYTAKAVEEFQKHHNLKVDGKVGSTTYESIMQAVDETEANPPLSRGYEAKSDYQADQCSLCHYVFC